MSMVKTRLSPDSINQDGTQKPQTVRKELATGGKMKSSTSIDTSELHAVKMFMEDKGLLPAPNTTSVTQTMTKVISVNVKNANVNIIMGAKGPRSDPRPIDARQQRPQQGNRATSTSNTKGSSVPPSFPRICNHRIRAQAALKGQKRLANLSLKRISQVALGEKQQNSMHGTKATFVATALLRERKAPSPIGQVSRP